MKRVRKNQVVLVLFLCLSLLIPAMPCYASASKPTATTSSASAGENSATLYGSVDTNGGAEITGYGFKWGTTSSVSDGKEYVGNENFKGSFDLDISGLKPGTKYYYQAFAQNSVGAGYGTVKSFTTDSAEPPPASKPGVTTSSASADETSATVNGSVDTNGGAEITGYGFKWGTTSSVSDGKEYVGNDNYKGSFDFNITGLKPGTKYYYQAFAQNSAGSGYGTVKNFTTDSAEPPPASKPGVTTSSASADETSATLYGSVDTNGGAEITGYGFKWGTTSSVADGKEYVGYDNYKGSFNKAISGLQPNTTYYYQAFAQNSAGSGYGTVKSFKTSGTVPPPASKPGVTTSSASASETSATLYGSVDTNGGAEITGYGFKWGTTSSVSDGKEYAGHDNFKGSFNKAISGLQPNTTYYYQAFAQNSAGSGYGDVKSFKTSGTVPPPASKPGVTTSSASASETSATLYGSVDTNGGAEITGYGFKWGTTSSVSDGKEYAGYDNFKGSFNKAISGLQPNTTYYYQAFAQNSAGSGYGDVKSFKTGGSVPPPAGKPGVTTSSASAAETSATLYGSVDTNGGAEITGYGFKWGTTSSVSDGKEYAGYDNYKGSFNKAISGLQPNTTYYYQAFAQNSAGSGYGAVKSFTTSGTAPGKPGVTTSSASATENSATLYGSVDTNGGAAITGYGFKWGTTSSVSDGKEYAGYDNYKGSFNKAISGLQPNTTYYYQAFAQTSAGAGYGAVKSFTTSGATPGKPTVTTSSASATENSATLYGSVDTNGGAAITGYGFKWGKTSSVADGKEYAGYDNYKGSFNKAISGLQPNTTFYYQAFAQTSAGAGYGAVKSFTTSGAAPGKPTVTTSSASATETSATLYGSVDTNGGAAITGYGFKWGTTSSVADGKEYVGYDNYKGSFNKAISGLQPNTTYYYQAFAQTSAGAGYGAVKSFITSGANQAPVVTIAQPQNGASFPAGSKIQIEASATDDVKVTAMGLYINDGTIVKQRYESNKVSYPWDTTGLSAGWYTIKVTAFDGTKADEDNIIRIQLTGPTDVPPVPPGENKAPVVTIAQPQNGASFPAGSKIQIEASATDDVKVTAMGLYINDGTIVKQRYESNKVSYPWDTNGLSAGWYTIKVTAFDGTKADEDNIIRIQLTGPTDVPPAPPGENKAPVVTIAQPLNGTAFPAGSKIQIEASATDDVKVTAMGLYINDGTIVKQRYESNKVSYPWDTTGLSAGWYTIKITAWDGQKSDEDNIIRVQIGDVGNLPGNMPEVTNVKVYPERGYASQEFTFTAIVKNNPQYVYIQFDNPNNGMLDKTACKNNFRFTNRISNSDGTETFTYKRAINSPGVSPNDLRSYNVYAVNGSLESLSCSGTFVVHPNNKPGINIECPKANGIYAKGEIQVKATASWNSAAMNLYQVISGQPDKQLIKEKVKGNNLDVKVRFDQSGCYTLKVTSVNIQNESTEEKVTIVVGDPEPKIINGPTPAFLTYGIKESRSIEIMGNAFITKNGQIDVVTFEEMSTKKQTSVKSFKVEANKVMITVPEDLAVGKYDIYLKNSKVGMDKVSGFEIKRPENTPPQVNISKPINSTVFKVGDQIKIEAMAADNTKVQAMRLSINYGIIYSERFTGDQISYIWNTAGLSPGWYVIHVTAWDGSKSDMDDYVKIQLLPKDIVDQKYVVITSPTSKAIDKKDISITWNPMKGVRQYVFIVQDDTTNHRVIQENAWDKCDYYLKGSQLEEGHRYIIWIAPIKDQKYIESQAGYVEVTVNKKEVPATSIRLINEYFMYEEDEEDFTVQFEPFNATNQKIYWSCDDYSLIKIKQVDDNSCHVSTVGIGWRLQAKVHLTAKSVNGKTATCAITILKGKAAKDNGTGSSGDSNSISQSQARDIYDQVSQINSYYGNIQEFRGSEVGKLSKTFNVVDKLLTAYDCAEIDKDPNLSDQGKWVYKADKVISNIYPLWGITPNEQRIKDLTILSNQVFKPGLEEELQEIFNKKNKIYLKLFKSAEESEQLKEYEQRINEIESTRFDLN